MICNAPERESLNMFPHGTLYVDKWKQHGLGTKCQKPLICDLDHWSFSLGGHNLPKQNLNNLRR